jgi:tetratricopeptide (TPR) repeat protein
VEVLRISAYRFKLPEKTGPTLFGDALVEAGDLDEAIEKYRTIAEDYKDVSISALALTKGYLLAVQRGDAPQRKYFYNELKKPIQFDWFNPFWLHPFQSATHAKYYERVEEVETLALWKEGEYQKALNNFPAIFQANPETRIVVECLEAEHGHLGPQVSTELLQWVEHTPELAGLDISSFDVRDLGALAAVSSLRGLDCSDNRLTGLDPLRRMDQLRLLTCRQNLIATLDPIRALKLIELDCSGNRIKDLSPLKGMPIYALHCSYNNISSLDPVSDLPGLGKLYCSSNHISSLEPLRWVKNLAYLDCSSNKIQTLEPLKDLELYSLDCSGNRLETLEPFVDTKNPPATFVFDCITLPDREIRRAIDEWSAKGLRSHVSYCELVLALRHDDFGKVRSLATPFAGHRYLFVQRPIRADEANQFCTELGGHLVTITKPEENEFLKEITPPDVSCRIGLIVSNGETAMGLGRSARQSARKELRAGADGFQGVGRDRDLEKRFVAAFTVARG